MKALTAANRGQYEKSVRALADYFHATELGLSEKCQPLGCNAARRKNIEELLEDLGGRLNRLRQSNIDEELFDDISGFEV